MRHVIPFALVVACGSPSTSSSPKGSKWYDADAPVGVWIGTNVAAHYDEGNFSQGLAIEGFALWPDGHLTRGLPWAGFADFDRAAWERDVGTDRSLGGDPGTYKRDGDGWTITYAGGRQAALKHVADRLETEHAKLSRAKDVTGATLDGVYTWWTDADDASLAGPGCQPLVAFTRDGHFDDRGGFSQPCQTSGPDAPGTGTYEIRDFSLVLHYGDGRTTKHLITAVVDADLHADNSRALVMGRAWKRRAAALAPAPAPAVAPAPAPTAKTPETTTFDAVAFATPPGQVQRTSSTIMFTEAPGDRLQCMTIVYAGIAGTGDPKRDFATDWKDVMLNGRSADASPVPEQGRNPHGLAFTAGGSMTTETGNGTRVYRALFVFEVGGRRVDVMMIAPSEVELSRCHVDTLLETITPA
jgi:hypothetical protein